MSRNKESNPLVSVVIPTYERPEYLEGAIKTSVGQTYRNIEVIVVDDGSTEQYADDVVAKFSQSVVCIRHDENRGLSAARNTGIRNSSGEYVAFLDDDDRWHKTKLARQVEIIEQEDQAGLATCLVAAISPDRKLIHCETSAPKGDCSNDLLISNKIGTPSRVLIRREAITDIGTFDESLPTKQDWDFYLRLCQRWRVVAVEDYLCFRTVHESMSSSPTALQRDKQTILKKHKDLIQKRGLWDQASADVAAEIGRAHLGIGDLTTARKNLRKSISWDPTVRRAVLFLFSHTHPWLVYRAINLKRKIISRYSDCTELRLNQDNIPGIPT